MTYPIIVYENNHVQLSSFQKVIQNHVMIQEYDMRLVLATTEINDVLAYIDQEDFSKGLFFLGINCENRISVINTAEKIRKKSEEIKIVFLASHEEFAIEILKRRIAALDYIVKGEGDKGQIESIIRDVYQMYIDKSTKRLRIFNVLIEGRLIPVEVKNIFYIESSIVPHKVSLYGSSFTYEFYGNLNEIEREFPELLRVHKSFLVNVNNALSIDFKKRYIYFPDDYCCYFSEKNKCKIKEFLKIE